jgi:hypothetical protein
MVDSHSYCEGLLDGYLLNREIKKTAVNIMLLQDSLRERGKPEGAKEAAWKKQHAKIYIAVQSATCVGHKEEGCRKRVERIFELLRLLRQEMASHKEEEEEKEI